MTKAHVAEPGSPDVRAELAEAKKARRELDRDFRKRGRELDRKIERLTKRATKGARARRPLTPAGQAGKANLRAAREAIRELGTATQAQIGEKSGVRTGSLTWACRALLESGEIEATGETVRGSREFRWTGAEPGQRVRRPGS